MAKLIEFFKKYKVQLVLIAAACSLLFFVAGGVYLQQFKSKKALKITSQELSKQIELKVKDSTGGTGADSTSGVESSSFFLEPSAENLVKQLKEMQNLRPDIAQQKLQSLRVLWQVYFFEIREVDQQKIVSFDISEDGFGVMVNAKYSSVKFPELEELERGRKLWVGGEIVLVNLSGTGSVEVDLEYISFSETIPEQEAAASSEVEKE